MISWCKRPINPVTLIWVSIERSFSSGELELSDVSFGQCPQKWSVMISKVDQRPMIVIAHNGQCRHQWVNGRNVIKPLQRKCRAECPHLGQVFLT